MAVDLHEQLPLPHFEDRLWDVGGPATAIPTSMGSDAHERPAGPADCATAPNEEEVAPPEDDSTSPSSSGPAMVVFQEQRNADGRIDHTWFDEESGRMRTLQLDAAGNPVYDSGWLSLETRPDGSALIVIRNVDYSTGEYTEQDWTPPGPLPESWRRDDEIEQGLADGTRAADGTEVIEGRELLRFVDAVDGVADAELGVTWYDPETGRAVRRVGYPGSDAAYTHTYEYLPRTPENLARLEVSIPEGFAGGG